MLNVPRLYLATFDRLDGGTIRLGQYEGCPVTVMQQVKERHPTFWASQRVRIEPVAPAREVVAG